MTARVQRRGTINLKNIKTGVSENRRMIDIAGKLDYNDNIEQSSHNSIDEDDPEQAMDIKKH